MKKKTPPPAPPALYLNRELSWLEFNERVLEEARDRTNPLLERLKFLAISCSNLDEFFMIRVASLKDLVNARYIRPDPAGLTPTEQLRAISGRTHQMVQRQYTTYNRMHKPALLRQRIRLLAPDELTAAQAAFVREYFNSTVFPILTPMAVDAARPFPLLANRSINLCVRIEQTTAEVDNDSDASQQNFALIQVPSVIPRLLALPSNCEEIAETTGPILAGAASRELDPAASETLQNQLPADEPDEEPEAPDGLPAGGPCLDFILLEDVVRMHLYRLFSGVHLGEAWCFRIMRNADLDIEEEDAADLLKEIEKQLKMRQWGQVIRLEAEAGFDEDLLRFLVRSLAIDQQDIYLINGPLDLTFLNKLYKLPDDDSLRYPAYEPQPNLAFKNREIFAAIRERDILLHHPYESFDPVVDFIRSAAEDPEVLAIKQTLYRVSGNSPIVSCLAAAAESGKQVLVLVELKARFDEENNIHWARKLEQSGCHVIYGLVGLKTHSKITLVVRRDEDGIRRYVHLGTGNYNDITAGIYTDYGLLTCSESFGADASEFFNMLSGYSAPLAWRKLVPAPHWMRQMFLRRIEQEKRHAEAGKPARIIAKLNSLVDPVIIDALYAASRAGVVIDLIVRGICCLRPGVPGLSEQITVRSIIGRYLEHSRIFYFYNDGLEDLFLASADWMPRNLDRRVELAFPIEDMAVWEQIMANLKLQLGDTNRTRLMLPDGRYERIDRRGKVQVDCQEMMCTAACAAASVPETPIEDQIFQPIHSV